MDLPLLSELNLFAYIDSRGAIASNFTDKIGIYAIYDATETLCYVGYSRNFKKSLKQHLVRCPDQCHWLKIHTCDRPNRTLLEEIKAAWMEENGSIPIGNGNAEALWTEPIDIKPASRSLITQPLAGFFFIGEMVDDLEHTVEITG